MTLIEELKWRGMLQDIMPGTAEQLDKEMTTAYIGFDPTADSLHIGSLVPILLLVHLQKKGHKPIALIGGATGMIGDPSGKSEERNLLSPEQLDINVAGIREQLEKHLDFNTALPNNAELVNNYDWFKNIGFIEFLRDTGKYITVNYMMAKDSVKKRIEGDTGISYTEFAYQLMQGYDYYWLYTHKNCRLQMGGSDQWGNITTGSELIRRKAGGEAFAFTCPLITKADGGKFGKTEKGNVWLNAERTSPYQFYQFWLNASDEDAEKWVKIFTFLSPTEINALREHHHQNPAARLLQKTLAKEVTIFIHGEEEYTKAIETTEKLFSRQTAPVESLSAEDLENMEGVIKFDYPRQKISNGIDIVSFLAETGSFSSKGEARKMIRNGGVSINRNKIDNISKEINTADLLHDKYVLIQKGKKNYYLVNVN
ncbi:tyrosine--tRNA ligase [Agriterribacter sp.]|uniref:tyrosine--tRNA ligase n=1 Tax=Agriterribacter sp. TaxID=2821509 RepID=UPI002C104E2E|nr:tyrosine--tRNA ligase [Agriterribacter sp.]HRP56403.1 tyrosine--tRNA ligase [Agriterribacter sp.]